MKDTNEDGGGAPHGARRAASAQGAGEYPSARQERATGLVRAAVREGRGGAAWA